MGRRGREQGESLLPGQDLRPEVREASRSGLGVPVVAREDEVGATDGNALGQPVQGLVGQYLRAGGDDRARAVSGEPDDGEGHVVVSRVAATATDALDDAEPAEQVGLRAVVVTGSRHEEDSRQVLVCAACQDRRVNPLRGSVTSSRGVIACPRG